MKKTYIAPCSITIEAEVEQVLNVSPRIKKDGFYMQYDGDPLHNDLSIHGGKMAGPPVNILVRITTRTQWTKMTFLIDIKNRKEDKI